MDVIYASSTGRSSAEESREQINRFLDEIARLSETDLAPADYYGELLKRVLPALTAMAGAIWAGTAQGLQLLYQINLAQVGLEDSPESRKAHEELLRQVFQHGRPLHLPAHSSPGHAGGNGAAGNPTGYGVLMAPLIVDRQVAAVLEVWHDEGPNPATAPLLMQMLLRLAGLAATYLRNHQRREMAGQQRLWTQLETFARNVHGSLNPGEVAYTIANEGRRLIACDRISIALRQGKGPTILGVSGCDVVEKRSNQVRLMRNLLARVLAWNETLVYRGTKDDSLPPGVLKALNAYLAESHARLLVALPLREERESAAGKRPRSALLMECFEPTETPEKLLGQLEVVGRHAATALYNASEYRRIPLRWVWLPLAKAQERMGGKASAIAFLVFVMLVALAAALTGIPYPLRMDAQGQLLPRERRWVYSPVEGQVVRFADDVQPGQAISENQSLVLLYDVQLELKLDQLDSEISGAEQDMAALARQQAAMTTEAERLRLSAEKKQKEFLRDSKMRERTALRERTHADEARPGQFWLKSPLTGTVLNWDFRENLTNRSVKPAEPLLRIGNKDKDWELELKIPQKHIGRILQAFDPGNPDAELDVDLLLMSYPTRTFKGKLARCKIAGEATPDRDEPGDSEPVVLASVRLGGPGIAEAERVPHDLLVTGTEVHSKVNCGNHPLGYSLFYGVGEFVYEKVIFYFMGNH